MNLNRLLLFGKQELQKKLKTLEIIQQNFTALLNAPEMQIPVSGKEPTL
ncbi:MAG: hypothetical protein ACLU80_04090 [Dorea sp.]